MPWLAKMMLASALCVGCTVGPAAGDGGVSEAGPATVGDQCQEIFKELCLKGQTCGISGVTLDQCISANMPTCCTGSQCSAVSGSSEAAVSACKQAIDAEDCNSVANNAVPAACQGVPSKS
jgi:hypothetical protein